MGWKSNRGPHSAGTSWQHFSGTVTLPKGPASEFVCFPSWSTCSIPFAIFIYCPSSHLLDWRSKQKLLFSTSWRQLQGERRRRGVLGLTGELLPLMTGHMATCVFLSRSLSFPLDTHKVCLFLNYFLAKVSRGKTPSWKPDKTKHRYSPNIQNPQPSQNEPSVATLLPSKSSLTTQHASSAHS